MPACPSLKPTTGTRSNGSFVSAAPPRSASLGVRLGLSLIRAYKLVLSPYFWGSCRFLPSCADYAAEAVTRHGLLRGAWLATRRLARCHPLAAAGCDPVPPERARPPALSPQPSRFRPQPSWGRCSSSPKA